MIVCRCRPVSRAELERAAEHDDLFLCDTEDAEGMRTLLKLYFDRKHDGGEGDLGETWITGCPLEEHPGKINEFWKREATKANDRRSRTSRQMREKETAGDGAALRHCV